MEATFLTPAPPPAPMALNPTACPRPKAARSSQMPSPRPHRLSLSTTPVKKKYSNNCSCPIPDLNPTEPLNPFISKPSSRRLNLPRLLLESTRRKGLRRSILSEILKLTEVRPPYPLQLQYPRFGSPSANSAFPERLPHPRAVPQLLPENFLSPMPPLCKTNLPSSNKPAKTMAPAGTGAHITISTRAPSSGPQTCRRIVAQASCRRVEIFDASSCSKIYGTAPSATQIAPHKPSRRTAPADSHPPVRRTIPVGYPSSSPPSNSASLNIFCCLPAQKADQIPQHSSRR
jgi:hypothetical protein